MRSGKVLDARVSLPTQLGCTTLWHGDVQSTWKFIKSCFSRVFIYVILYPLSLEGGGHWVGWKFCFITWSFSWPAQSWVHPGASTLIHCFRISLKGLLMDDKRYSYQAIRRIWGALCQKPGSRTKHISYFYHTHFPRFLNWSIQEALISQFSASQLILLLCPPLPSLFILNLSLCPLGCGVHCISSLWPIFLTSSLIPLRSCFNWNLFILWDSFLQCPSQLVGVSPYM